MDPDIEMNSDSDDDDEIKEDTFGLDDIKEVDGCVVSVIAVDKDKTQSIAIDYVPGGSLVLNLKCGDPPLSEAYVSVMSKKTEFDMFPSTSGTRLGRFLISYP